MDAPEQFVIFFGFDKCNITAEADAVLSEAASAAKATGAASIRIVGHTDTMGSNTYNEKLSNCRADAAKVAELQESVEQAHEQLQRLESELDNPNSEYALAEKEFRSLSDDLEKAIRFLRGLVEATERVLDSD